MFAGRVFVPATLLHYVSPWEQEAKPPWNPLMYDSVGQFYPWRHFAAAELHAGRIPLWNPYQFCGTPFVANSQSAVFYPGNLLYWLLPTATAAGPNVILHLCLAGWFTFAFLRSYRLSVGAAVLGGVAFAFSGWQVSWLSLPTFLCTSCWLPLVLLCVRRLFESPSWRRTVALGVVCGVTTLAGHLQIAFYVLLTAILYACWLAATKPRGTGPNRPAHPASRSRFAGSVAASLLLGGMLAAPQVLPSLELSKRSHRAAPVSAAGFQQYAAYAVSPASLVTLVLPDYYGNPSDPAEPYVGASRGGAYFNFSEGALYVGIPTLLLAAFALFRIRQIGTRELGFFGLLAILALLLATGSFVDALLYFYMPGFGQSGSPGRALVLWAFALSCLAAFGYEKLCHDDAAPVKTVTAGIAVVAAVAVVGILAGPSAVFKGAANPGALAQLPRQSGLFLLSAGILMGLASGKLRGTRYAILPLVLVAVDLLAAGASYNLTASASDVYPQRPSLDSLKQLAGHDRIMPVNHGWSFAGPRAVLPPNGAMVFGLRDVQGYDSLFPGQYKAFMNALSGRDASPPEVGNMVFARDPSSPLVARAGVRYVLSRQELPLPGRLDTGEGYLRFDVPGAVGRASTTARDGRPASVEWLADDPDVVSLRVTSAGPGSLTLADQRYPGWRASVDGRPTPIGKADDVFRSIAVDGGSHIVRFTYEPAAFRTGLYLACIVMGTTAAAAVSRRRSRT